jgi:hypothetical protein
MVIEYTRDLGALLVLVPHPWKLTVAAIDRQGREVTTGMNAEGGWL